MNEKHHDFKPLISDKAKITGKGHIKIGAFTVIGDYVLLDTANDLNSYIIIGKRCKFKKEQDGITIGVGCVVGAGSVVTEDLPSNTICYGVPCKVVREIEKPQWLTNNVMGDD